MVILNQKTFCLFYQNYVILDFEKFNGIAGEEAKNVTLYYAAPELFINGDFDTVKADIYAIGITLYALSEWQFPFINGNQNFIVQQIITGCLSIRNGLNYRLLRLAQKCTAMNPKLRPVLYTLEISVRKFKINVTIFC